LCVVIISCNGMVVFLVEIHSGRTAVPDNIKLNANKWRNVGSLMFNSMGEIYPVIVRRYEQSISGCHPSLDLLLGRETGSATTFTSVLECWAYPSHCVSAWYVMSRKGNLCLTHTSSSCRNDSTIEILSIYKDEEAWKRKTILVLLAFPCAFFHPIT